MYEVLFGLCFRCWFYQYPQVFVPNKCVLWLQSRSCFMAIFCLLTLSRVFITWGLILLNFYYPLVLFTICFVASEQKMFYGQLFVTWLRRARIETRGLNSLTFSRPGLVYYVFCGSRAEVVLRQFLLPDSVENVLEAGA